MAQFRITTTGSQSPVIFDDLGARSFTHPTNDYDLLLEFKAEEIRDSTSVQNAITDDHITVKDEFGNDIYFTTQAVSHSNLASLEEDDHEQYTITDGTSRVIVHVNDPVNEQVLQYDSGLGKWINVDSVAGTSGTSGIDGTSGTSGTSGIDGTSGTSGIDGTSGSSGESGTSGSSGSSGSSGATPRGAVYYLKVDEKLEQNPGTGLEQTKVVPNINSKTLIDEWTTEEWDPAIEIMPAGVWVNKMYASVADTGTEATLHIDVYRLIDSTTEVLIVSSESGSFNNDSAGLVRWETIQTNNVDMNLEDRFRVKVYADSTANASVTLYYEGLNHASYISTPIFIGGAGTSGTSGTSGVGSDGTSGTSGTSGIDGTSGTSGIDGTSGTSGIDGTSGTSGTSGIDGTSGTSGTSGIDGTSGTSGTSGIDGTSGTSGIDGTSGTSGTAGTSGTSADGVYYDSTANEVVYFDEERSKLLSTSLIHFSAGRNSLATTNQYLRGYDGSPLNLNGYALLFNATLVGISVSGQNVAQTYTIEVRRNDVATVIDSLTVTNSRENHDYTKDTDFDEGDRIQFYCNGTSIDRPLVTAYFRRRI